MRTIMAFLGYVKVPKEVILLSIEQEEFLKKVGKREPTDVGRIRTASHIEGQKAITQFLRSGQFNTK